MSADIEQTVQGCPRCGGDHETLVLRPLARAITEGCFPPLTHWAPCPSNGEPILGRMDAAATKTRPALATFEVDAVSVKRIRRAIDDAAGEGEQS